MDLDEEARETLERLIRENGEDYASVSRLIGRNAAYIQQYIKRGVPKRLREVDRKVIARYFGIDEAALGAPEAAQAAVITLAPRSIRYQAPQPMEDEFIYISQYDVAASAGHGALVDREEPLTTLAFRKSWIQSMGYSSARDLAIIQVEGDSMLPTLADGDHILIDLTEDRSLRDGVYVIRFENTLQVKRISLNPTTASVAVRSDNPAYENWPDCPVERIDFVGRVIWVGRKL
ncbi:MAG: S24 family peptidase [Pseudomonadota bacterium]